MAGTLLNFLYPIRCPACRDLLENDGKRIHEVCKDKFRLIKEPRCLKCGRHVEAEEIDICFECSKKELFFDYGLPVFEYNDTAKMAMLDYKQKGWRSNGEFFAYEAAERIGPALLQRNPQVLIPVPVHPSKLRERGFNQATVIANIIGEKLGIPVDDGYLLKTVKTAQQKSLSGNARQKNSSAVFKCEGNRAYDRVCIIDDIYTTGSTINACAYCLKQAGVAEVGFVTVCSGRNY